MYHYFNISHPIQKFSNQVIDSLWDIIRLKYELPGQYVDNDIMMATVKAININIQLHGESNVLLDIKNRLNVPTIHLLYCGNSINGNRGNHYDALLPNNNTTNNHNYHLTTSTEETNTIQIQNMQTNNELNINNTIIIR